MTQHDGSKYPYVFIDVSELGADEESAIRSDFKADVNVVYLQPSHGHASGFEEWLNQVPVIIHHKNLLIDFAKVAGGAVGKMALDLIEDYVKKFIEKHRRTKVRVSVSYEEGLPLIRVHRDET